jgi:AbrB family looped-hinge helix DNA binding protein
MPLRKINDDLRITVPRALRQELGLRPGDYVDWVRENGNVKLKFVKVEPPAVLEAEAI